jgi:hypothetical protein
MTRRATALGTGHYLPARIVPNSEFEATLDTTDEWIRSRSGIERRRFAAEDETTSTLALHAARAALAQRICVQRQEQSRGQRTTADITLIRQQALHVLNRLHMLHRPAPIYAQTATVAAAATLPRAVGSVQQTTRIFQNFA